MLAHGGGQIQVERTMAALRAIGVDIDHLRWWDDRQDCDLLHHVGAVPSELVTLAHNKGRLVVNTILLSETCNRSRPELWLRKALIRAALLSPIPAGTKQRLPWRSFHECDRVIVGLEAEKYVLTGVYGVEPRRVSVVPLGIGDRFLKAGTASRSENHLICTGTICPPKNSLKLARLAAQAGVPVLFVGKPFDASASYWQQFRALIDNKIVKHHPHVNSEEEMIDLLRQARGYVLLSRFENWSLTTHEAAAVGLPMLLPDKPWSRERFGDQASYWPKSRRGSADALRCFYDACPSLPSPRIRLYSWIEVAEMLRKVYEGVLAR